MFLAIIQILLSIAIITLILLQQRSAGMSGFLGGSGEGSGVYQTRRGMEKAAYNATIILSVVFVALALYQLVRS